MREIKSIGLVGAGEMGSSLGHHLLAAGWPLTVADQNPDALASLTDDGANPMSSPAEVASISDLVFIAVVDDAQTEDVIQGSDGLLATAQSGAVLAICSTVHPETCRRLAAASTESEVHVVDVALVGGARYAKSGALTLFCGGPAEVLKACQPIFRAFAINVCHLGDVGSGQVAKTVNNILLWTAVRADVEALRLGRAFGVDPSRLRAAAAIGSGANRVLMEWSLQNLTWPQKDLELARNMASEVGLELPLIESLGVQMSELSVDDLRDLR